MTRRWRSIVVMLAAGAAVACTSPEATRSRGSGAGADVGNHPRGDLQIHAGAEMYYGTPRRAVPAGAAEAGER